MSAITKDTIEQAYSFGAYFRLVEKAVAAGESTGENDSEDLAAYTKLNLQRMTRLLKTITINSELSAKLKTIQEPVIWLVLTEGWCGDAAQNVPVLHKMAQQNSNIQLRLILRDENLEIMDQFLTDGGRSIPKLIALHPETLTVHYTWGPRPQPAQKMMIAFKEGT